MSIAVKSKFNQFVEVLFSRRFHISLLIILALGLRVYAGSLKAGFAQDQARDELITQSFLRNKQVFVEYGPKASVGNFYFPPFYYQLMYWVNILTGFTPLSMKWVIILVESFTPAFLYLVLKFYVDKRSAYLASLMYAFSPLVIIFSSFMWNPNMIPFLTVFSWWSLNNYIFKRKGWGIIGGLIGVLLAWQLHYQVTVMFLFLLIVFIYTLVYRREDVKFWILGMGIILITLIPYIRAEVVSGYRNTRQIYKFVMVDHVKIYDRVSKPMFFISFLPSFMERLIVNQNLKGVFLGRLLFFFGNLALGWYFYKNRKKGTWLFIYITSLLFMFRVYKGDKLDYYMLVIYNLPFIYTALISNYFKRIGLVLGLIVFGFSGYHLASLLPENGYQNLLKASEFIKSQVTDNGVRIWLHEKDFENNFKYGFYKIGIREDKQSNLLAEIYYVGQYSIYDGMPVCIYNVSYEEGALFKIDNNYQKLSEYTNDSYFVVMGKVKNLR